MGLDLYITKRGKRIKATPEQWRTWFAKLENRIVGSTAFPGGRVSTVFIGVSPIFFETMVFGGRLDQWRWRYQSNKQAIVGHQRVVKNVRFLLRILELQRSKG